MAHDCSIFMFSLRKPSRPTSSVDPADMFWGCGRTLQQTWYTLLDPADALNLCLKFAGEVRHLPRPQIIKRGNQNRPDVTR